MVVLPGNAGDLFAALRALGFDDAGPLPRYFAPARPGLLRRTLTAALLPAPRLPESLSAVPEALPAREERALRERLAPRFGAFVEPAPESSPGVHLRRDGEAVASCRFAPGAGGAVEAREWIAPPDEPDLAAALALAALDRAGTGVTFETTHAVLGRGLLLARFLPRPARARILVRQGGDRDLFAPRTTDWHLTAPARIGSGAW